MTFQQQSGDTTRKVVRVGGHHRPQVPCAAGPVGKRDLAQAGQGAVDGRVVAPDHFRAPFAPDIRDRLLDPCQRRVQRQDLGQGKKAD